MNRSVTLTDAPIDECALTRARSMSDGMGAAVSFSGVVRRAEGEALILAIEYEAFEKMALHQFELILDEVEQKWPIESVRLIHRLGRVEVNVASIWIEVIAPHRGEAFAACQFVVDEMKKRVPIWKKPVPEAPVPT